MIRIGLTFSVLALLLSAGCNFLPCDFGLPFLSPAGPQSVGEAVADNLNDPNTPAKNSPAAKGDPIRLRVSNPSTRDADCRVTMEVVGREVHFTLRRVIASTESLVIGPDRADVIRVDATFLGSPALTMDTQILRLGVDYNAGDTVAIILTPPADDSQQDIPDDQNDDVAPPPPPVPTIAIHGLDADVTVPVGEIVNFSIVTTDAPAGSLVSAFADPIDPNFPTVEIAGDVPAASTVAIAWNTTDVAGGAYEIRAELQAGDDLIVASPPAGRVILEPLGACCYPDQACEILVERECLLGEWLGPDTVCDDCPACLVICPAENSRPESELCGDDTNSGCFDPCTPRFEPIACGETVCGTTWLNQFDPNEPNTFKARAAQGDSLRPGALCDPNSMFLDIDWYEFSIGHDAEVTFTITAEFPVLAAFMEQETPGVPGCDNFSGGAAYAQWGVPCETLTLSRILPQGTHYLILMPLYIETPSIYCTCENDYTITLQCVPADYVTGACCFYETCEELTEQDCSYYGGNYQGDDISCDSNPCAPPLGACCFSGGDCSYLTDDDCLYSGGDSWAEGVGCEPNPCPQPLGACCQPDGTCDYITEAACLGFDFAGVPTWDESVTCDPNPCPPPPTGACCDNEGGCTIVTEEDCYFSEASWQGPLTTCDPNPCPQPTGACCIYVDCQILTEGQCISSDGEYQGDFTTCDPNTCLPPIGACCFSTGYCEVMEEFDCLLDGGSFWGDGTTCEPDNPCPQPPTGACCLDGTCTLETADGCSVLGGEYLGDDTPCEPNPCQPPSGACCIDGECQILAVFGCLQSGGVYQGDGTTCDPNPCVAATGACCLYGNECQVLSEPNCAMMSGVYVGDYVSCDDPNLCIPAIGDNCENAIWLDAMSQLPFSVSGETTCGRLDYYHETCMDLFDEGEEIVYRIMIKIPTKVTVTLDPKGTPYTGMSLSPYCPSGEVCIIATDAAGAGAPYEINCEYLEPGVYTLMIDLAELGGGCIPDFDLQISACGSP